MQVAWSKKYLALFNYPKNLMYVDCPIDQLIRYNARQGDVVLVILKLKLIADWIFSRKD